MIAIREDEFDPWSEIQQYQQQHFAAGAYGATAVFVGTMRDFNEDEKVTSLFLEHYPGMTEKFLEKIITDAKQRWAFLDALIVHRVGELLPNMPIVLVCVWSAHRAAAFDASRYMMEALKSEAPFWKREVLTQGARWVTHNTSGNYENNNH